MTQIRKRTLKATWWIYLGFLIGAVNVYFLTHNEWFSVSQYGLTTSLRELSMLVAGISTLGATSFLYKFFPYYEDNLEPNKNDLLGLALKVSLSGFIVIASSFYFIKPLVIQKFSANSLLLVEYFYYLLPMGFFILLFQILEAYAYGFGKGVLTSFLREALVRFYTFLVIVLKITGLIDFDTFMKLFVLQYLALILVLAIILYREKRLWISFKQSRVTFKFRKKIIAIMGLTSLVVFVSVLRSSIDSLVLASKLSLASAGYFAFASYLTSLMQAPFRSIVAVTVPLLSRAWKNKDQTEIKRIYKRSSINLLSFALFAFLLILLNFTNAIDFFNINPEYHAGKWVFFIVGIVTIIEMGTGVNGQIIGTSVYWRFELWTSLLLTALIIPMSYFLTVKYGIMGPALSNLISFSVYNAVRIWFLWDKFHLQPFSQKTLEVILLGISAFALTYFVFRNITGLPAMVGSSLLFTIVFGVSMYVRNISPDLKPVIQSFRKRFSKIKS
ncbi:MAG: polysaccharide biosynthesis C-terminal domain-containing protein [Ferruginibacter sp.]